jgi:CspA family cold shock protein
MSTTAESSTERYTGQVKWFNTKAGYGFITVCDGEHVKKDIFVHYSSIKVVNSQYRYLVQGEYVDFHLVKPEGDKYEFHAIDITGVKGGPIMCETRRIAMESQPRRPTSSRAPRGSRAEESQDASDELAERVIRKRPVEQQDTDAGFEKVVKKRAAPRTKATARA